MLFCYALLFFLFGTSVIAAPVQTDGRASIAVPTGGTYWFLKKPPTLLPQMMWNRVLFIEGEEYSLLVLNEQFQINKASKQLVAKERWHFLAGVWAPIPTSKTADDHPLGELIISAPDGPSSHIDMKFLSTPRASTEGQLDLKLLPDAYVTSSESANGYWVLGDTLKDAFDEGKWRDILEIKDGKYYTFRVDPQLNIIGSKREVKAPTSGNYYAVPYVIKGGVKPPLLALKVRQRGVLEVLKYQTPKPQVPSHTPAYRHSPYSMLPGMGMWM